MARLSIRLLGSFHAELDGEPITGFATDKARALLAYLAVEAHRPHRREALAGLLWPDYPERSARISLRSALANLRQVIGDREADPAFLNISHQTVQLDSASDTWVDVKALTELLEFKLPGGQTGRRLEDAIALYRGDFLEGFSFPDSATFEEWALLTREQLHRQAVDTLHRLVEWYEASGEYEAALPHAWRQVELDPWRERAQRQLMRLLAFTGQRGAALAQYEACRQMLEAELGVEPSAETQETYAQLVSGEWPATVSVTAGVEEECVTPLPECPYRGLAAFREEDAPYFFGRDAFAARLVEAVRRRPLLAVVVGSSGSGKSSAVYAGLLPLLRGTLPRLRGTSPRLRNQATWLISDFRPGCRPYDALAAAILPTLRPQLNATDRLIESRNLAEALSGGDITLYDLVEQALDRESGASRLLLIVDQFEELYTLCPEPEERRRFLGGLLAAIDAAGERRESPFALLLTLRADFMGQALAHRPFADALQEALVIMGPMDREELRASIERPAEIQGVAFESGLVERVLDDVGQEPGNLPLLEFALTLLWERGTEGRLTHAAYEELGQVEGALARYADQVYGELYEAEQAQARQVFLQLVRPGEGTEDTRRVAIRAELGEADANWELVQHLADKRLVVTGRDAAGNQTVEVVHEALIQRWGLLREWMEANRAFRTWQERLRAALRGWEASDRDDGALPRGGPLVEAEDWLAEREGELSLAERDFIQAGVALREWRAAERERRRRRTIIALACGLVIALVLALLARQQWRRAEEEVDARAVAQAQEAAQRVTAEANAVARATAQAKAEAAEEDALRQASVGLVAQALAELEGAAPERAVLLALEALEHYPYTPQAERALAQAVEAHIPTFALEDLAVYGQSALGAAWSPDGEKIAVVTDGKVPEPRIALFDANTGIRLLDIPHTVKSCVGWRVDWSPAGDRFVTTGVMDGGADQACPAPQVWDAGTGARILSLTGHEGLVWNVDWSPNRATIVTAGADGSARIWDADTGVERLALSGHTSTVYGAAWSPEGDWVVTASEDGTARVWDPDNGAELLTLPGHSGSVYGAAWSPDGTRIVTASADGLARVYLLPEASIPAEDGATGVLERVLSGHSDEVRGVAWSPDGDRIATASLDNTARIWDAVTGVELIALYSPSAMYGCVAWSPAGDQLFISDWRVAPIWDLPAPPLKLSGHIGAVWDAQWSPDGKRIATTSLDGTARIWDAATGEQLRTFDHPARLNYFDWSPDGTRIATTSFDASTRVWDVVSGELLLEIPGGGLIPSWSPDGSRLVIARDPDVIAATVYDAATGKTLATLEEGGCWLHRPSWSPEGDRFVTGCYQPLDAITYPDGNTPARIWDAATGEVLATLDSDDGWTVAAEWSTDGRRIVAAYGNGSAKVWDVASGTVLQTFAGHADFVWDVKWSPDGTRVVSSDQIGMVKVWDAATGDEFLSFTTPGNTTSVNWSPDGNYVIAGGTVYNTPVMRRAWQSTEQLIAHAGECCVTRELTDAEREQFGLPPR